MRAVFSVHLSSDSNNDYPSNKDFLNLIRVYGWDDIKFKELTEAEREQRYHESAQKIWDIMPEVSEEEKRFVVFFGVLQDSQTKFVITRVTEGAVTFRLLHPNLNILQASTAAIIKKLLQVHSNKKHFQITNQSVVIYERGSDSLILRGRVIANPLLEALRRDSKDLLLFVFAYILLVPVLATIILMPTTNISMAILGTLERLSTALLVTSIIGGIGFFQTYIDVRRHRLIQWDFAQDVGY